MDGWMGDDGHPDNGRHVLGMLDQFSDASNRPTFDAVMFVDRLRFLGVPSDVIAETDRRVRANAQAGVDWASAWLEQRRPPRPPPTCDCGEPLVGADWQGRATVECGQCGARWALEVIDHVSESIWAVSGPTPEWKAAHPDEDGDPYGDFQPDAVLRDGLPPLPSAIEPGTYFPLATWQHDGHGAVLYLYRARAGEFDLPGEEYEDETWHLVRRPDGGWTPTGSGGGTWVNALDPPTALLERYVVLGTGMSGSGEGDDATHLAGGLCSPRVTSVEVSDARGVRKYRVNPRFRVFLVGVHGPGEVRVLDEQGQVVRDCRGVNWSFPVGR